MKRTEVPFRIASRKLVMASFSLLFGCAQSSPLTAQLAPDRPPPEAPPRGAAPDVDSGVLPRHWQVLSHPVTEKGQQLTGASGEFYWLRVDANGKWARASAAERQDPNIEELFIDRDLRFLAVAAESEPNGRCQRVSADAAERKAHGYTLCTSHFALENGLARPGLYHVMVNANALAKAARDAGLFGPESQADKSTTLAEAPAPQKPSTSVTEGAPAKSSFVAPRQGPVLGLDLPSLTYAEALRRFPHARKARANNGDPALQLDAARFDMDGLTEVGMTFDPHTGRLSQLVLEFDASRYDDMAKTLASKYPPDPTLPNDRPRQQFFVSDKLKIWLDGSSGGSAFQVHYVVTEMLMRDVDATEKRRAAERDKL